MNKPEHKPSTARAITADLQGRLSSGVWAQGAPIPSETDLAREFGVCRATIVKSLKELERMGLLVSRQGKGRVVADGQGAQKTTGSLGVVLPDMDHLFHPVQAQQLAGIRSVLAQTEWHLKIFALNAKARKSTRPQGSAMLDMLDLAGVDGVLLITFLLSQQQVLELAAKTPVVWMGHTNLGPRISGAMHDNAAGMFDAARYLVSLGHRNIGLVTLIEEIAQGRDQCAGARLGIRDPLAEQPASLSIKHLPSNASQGGYTATLELLSHNPRPTAILCGSDDLAQGVLKAIAEKKLIIPKDISVIGWNDVLTSEQTPVPLTTIKQDYYELARMCAQRLVDMVEQKSPLPELSPLAGKLIIRQSTAPPIRARKDPRTSR